MNVNFIRLLLLLVPAFLRKGVLKSFFQSVAAALQSCKNNIDRYFTDINYHVRVTPQTFSLEKMLNDKCDPILRRIYIKLPEPQPLFYFSESGDPEMKYFSNDTYFMFNSTGYTHDFTVFLPLQIQSEDMTNYVSALLNKYKLISKSFIIKYV
jgi:hypothetical protein